MQTLSPLFCSYFYDRCTQCWIEWKINIPTFIFLSYGWLYLQNMGGKPGISSVLPTNTKFIQKGSNVSKRCAMSWNDIIIFFFSQFIGGRGGMAPMPPPPGYAPALRAAPHRGGRRAAPSSDLKISKYKMSYAAKNIPYGAVPLCRKSGSLCGFIYGKTVFWRLLSRTYKTYFLMGQPFFSLFRFAIRLFHIYEKC